MGDEPIYFNIGESDADGYRTLIDGLRRRAAVDYYQNVPILAREETRPTRWFNVQLRSLGGRVATFRFRQDNLYLVGYQIHRTAQWFEFTDDDGNRQQLIPGSTSIGYGGGYQPLQNNADRRAEEIPLSRDRLSRAVDILVGNNFTTVAERRDRGQSLIIIIVMFSESMRLVPIENFIVDNYYNSGTLTPQLRTLINAWDNVSLRILTVRGIPGHEFQTTPALTRDHGIITLEDAVEAMGIVMHCNNTGPSTSHGASRRHPREADEGVCHLPSGGQPLVQVFWVRVQYAASVYGTITFNDALGQSESIYNRAKNDSESIGDGGYCTLSGPKFRCITATDSFTVDFDLWHHNSILADQQVSRGTVSWNAYDTVTHEYDKSLSRTIPGGGDFYVTLQYKVLSNAVEATVEVFLMQTPGDSYIWAWGDLESCCSDSPNDKYCLYSKGWENSVTMYKGGEFSLRSPVVAVPVGSSLMVRALLKDYNRLATDSEIANGSEDFPAKYSGSDVKYISGRDGQIKVKVTWTAM